MDFDESRIFYSHQALQSNNSENEQQGDNNNGDNPTPPPPAFELDAVRRHFREFLRNYRQGPKYLYRDLLKNMHHAHESSLEIDLAHLGEYDVSLMGYLLKEPNSILPTLELAAVDALKSLLYNASSEQNFTEHIQILIKGNLSPTLLRSIQSRHLNSLIQCRGIVISSSPVRCRIQKAKLQCHSCLDEMEMINDAGPFGSLALPAQCRVNQDGKCGNFPYVIMTDESTFINRQTLKLQEAPEMVPTGEMPRSVLLAAEDSLVDQAPPGTRVSVWVIPCLFQNSKSSVRSIYLQVVGMQRESVATSVTFTKREQEAFGLLSKSPQVYQILSNSVAPSISGSYTVDIKKAVVCQLFGGSHKRQKDGVALRGDLNVLLLGDPSTAKSQFLKFASRVAPVGIYTSGKGSSAAGLTASVVKDRNGEFYLEGGAMVLADGGICAIDEFDKMRPADRVAIHEAMEQQTISVAKAGITTVLHSRSSVLAAANPVFGRYDEFKTAWENIDLMTTILSRFDLIFLVRDVRQEERDKSICRHVMGVHMGSNSNREREKSGNEVNASNSPQAIVENITRVLQGEETELTVEAMKKYIQYCKAHCSPRLSEESGNVLASAYVKIRETVRVAGGEKVIPITVRQLEALVRISESLAKMRLDADVCAEDVAEALRLFRVSTMAANSSESQNLTTTGAGGQDMERSQQFLSSRLTIGNLVNKQRLLEEAGAQGFHAMSIAKAIAVMVMKGQVQERNQGRLLKRIK